MPDEPKSSEQVKPAAGKGSPTVGWFELFFDLVVVAAVNVTNDKFIEHPSGSTAAVAVLGLTALCWVWFVTTIVNNVHPQGGTVRRLLMLVQMVALLLAALAVEYGDPERTARGLVAYGVALGVAAVMILLATRFSARAPLGREGALVAVSAAICIVAGLIAPAVLWPYLVLALVLGIAPLLIARDGEGTAPFVLRANHLRERLGLFVLIVLGDGFLLLVQALAQHGSVPNMGVFAMTFVISVCIWWIYFDGTFAHRTEGPFAHWRLALLGHLALVFGMIGTLDCLVLFTVREQDRLGDQSLAYFAASAAVVLVSFALIGFAARGHWGRVSWVQAGSAVALVVAALAVLPGADVPVYAAMTTVGLVFVANAAFAAWSDRRYADSLSGV